MKLLLKERLFSRSWFINYTLIITSDHGMGSSSPDRYINLSNHIPPHWVGIKEGYNPIYLIKARDGYYDSILSVIQDIPHVSGWPGEKVPGRLVFGKNLRIPDFVMIADSAWSIGWQPDPGLSKGVHAEGIGTVKYYINSSKFVQEWD